MAIQAQVHKGILTNEEIEKCWEHALIMSGILGKPVTIIFLVVIEAVKRIRS